MKFLVQLVHNFDGESDSLLDDDYTEGVVVEGKPEQEANVLQAAMRVWHTSVLTGERYRITQIDPTGRLYDVVSSDCLIDGAFEIEAAS